MSSSSGKTEESLTAFADSTLRTLAANDHSLDISFLPAPEQYSQPELHGVSPIKASESDTLLEGLWIEVGDFTNHQDMFGDLDWGPTMVTVRINLILLIFLYGKETKSG